MRIGCGETLTNRTGEIQHQRSSSDLKNDSQKCSWRISLSEGQRIMIKFNYVNFASTQCQNSNLTLHSRGGETWRKGGGALPITFCHEKPPPHSLKIRSHSVILTLHDPSMRNSFHITYRGFSFR